MNSVETDSAPAAALDRAAIKRRRRWLYGFAALALIAVCGFAGYQLFGGGADTKSKVKPAAKPPVILARIELKSVPGQTGEGLGELVRRPKTDGIRVLAIKLKPTLDGEVYQLLLVGSGSASKLLGSEIVGSNKTFVGEAKIDTTELLKYSRLELRRVGQGNPPTSKLVLSGAIPR